MILTLSLSLSLGCNLSSLVFEHFHCPEQRSHILGLLLSVILSFILPLFAVSSSLFYPCCFSLLILYCPLLPPLLTIILSVRAFSHTPGWKCCVSLPSTEHGYGGEGRKEEAIEEERRRRWEKNGEKKDKEKRRGGGCHCVYSKHV